jgi:hypothetical protein
MMRPGISRVVVEIIILVIAVALALLIFSPISGYIFGSLGRTATVGGATTITVQNAEISSGGDSISLYVKNLGPGSISGANAMNPGNWTLVISGSDIGKVTITSASSGPTQISGTVGSNDPWDKDEVLKVTFSLSGVTLKSTSSYNIVLYGPGNTMTQYLYSGG